jgi:hypothetical protein
VLGALALAPSAQAQSVGRLPDPASPASSAASTAPAAFPAPSSAPARPVDPSASRYPRETQSTSQAWSGSATQPYSGGYTQPFVAAAAPAASPTPSYGGFYPAVLPHREGQPVPPGYRLEERHNRGLANGGFVTFGISYATGLGYAVANGFEDGTGWLALPLAGPWIAIGSQEIKCNKRSLENDCVEQALGGAERITFMTVDGLLQAVGLTLIFVGYGIRTSELVRSDVASLRLELKPRGVAVTGSF